MCALDVLQIFFGPANRCLIFEIIGRQMIKSEFQHVSKPHTCDPSGEHHAVGNSTLERQSVFACSMSFLSFSLQDANTTACAKKR